MTYSQEAVKVQVDSTLLLDSRKPSAFITFEKYGDRSDVREGENKQGVFLRLRNNSRFKVYLNANGAEDLNADHRVSYEVRGIPGSDLSGMEKKLPIGTLLFHKTRVRELEGGQSIVFSVPIDHLAEGFGIFVNFSYEWELGGQMAGDFSIIHQAQFWSTQLPPTGADKKR